jgi:hypothetical protein
MAHLNKPKYWRYLLNLAKLLGSIGVIRRDQVIQLVTFADVLYSSMALWLEVPAGNAGRHLVPIFTMVDLVDYLDVSLSQISLKGVMNTSIVCFSLPL